MVCSTYTINLYCIKNIRPLKIKGVVNFKLVDGPKLFLLSYIRSFNFYFFNTYQCLILCLLADTYLY